MLENLQKVLHFKQLAVILNSQSHIILLSMTINPSYLILQVTKKIKSGDENGNFSA